MSAFQKIYLEAKMEKKLLQKQNVFNITFTAMMIALSVVFEYLTKVIPFLTMPNGGGISLSMLPIAIAAVTCGWQYGLACGAIYGILNCFLIDGYQFNLVSFILDYIVAFAGISVIAVFNKQIRAGKKMYFIYGFLIGLLIRLIASGFSGVINAGVWGYDEAFLEGVFGAGKGSMIYLYIYSFIFYNLPYIAVSGGISIVIGLLTYKKILDIKKY